MIARLKDMETRNEIRDAVKGRKLVIGTRTVMKDMKKSRIARVIYASNCPPTSLRDLERCSKASKAELKGFGGDSVKLGEACGKPFTSLVVGIRK